MKKQIELPEWISLKMFQKLNGLENTDDLNKIVKVVSSITDNTEEDVRGWDLDGLKKVFNGIQDNLFEFDPILLPIFEFEGVMWGLQPLSKMTVGEYVDLENILKDGTIAEAISIMYRPITRNDLGGLEWKIKMNLKYVVGEVENLFKYYDIEKYDFRNTITYKRILENLPVSVALGAYNFFLLTGMEYQVNTLISSGNLTKMEKMMVEQMQAQLSANFTAGFSFSTN